MRHPAGVTLDHGGATVFEIAVDVGGYILFPANVVVVEHDFF